MNPFLAIRHRLLSVFIGAVTSAFMRIMGSEFPLGELVFFRTFFGVITLIALYTLRGEMRDALRTTRPSGHFWRGFFGVVSMFTFVAALTRLPLVDVTIISYSAPLMTVGLAAIFLKERVKIYRWTAVFSGFCGTVIMLWPYLSVSSVILSSTSIGALLAFFSAMCSSITNVQIRSLTKSETTTSIVFYFYVTCMLMGALTLPFGWEAPTAREWLLLTIVGALSAFTHVLATEAYRNAPTAITACFDYTGVFWAFLIGYFFFGELPTIYIYVGGAIVVASGLFILWREHKLHLDRRRGISVPPAQL